MVSNGFQGYNEVIPQTDPLVAYPPGLGPYTPYSVHVTLAGERPAPAAAPLVYTVVD